MKRTFPPGTSLQLGILNTRHVYIKGMHYLSHVCLLFSTQWLNKNLDKNNLHAPGGQDQPEVIAEQEEPAPGGQDQLNQAIADNRWSKSTQRSFQVVLHSTTQPEPQIDVAAAQHPNRYIDVEDWQLDDSEWEASLMSSTQGVDTKAQRTAGMKNIELKPRYLRLLVLLNSFN